MSPRLVFAALSLALCSRPSAPSLPDRYCWQANVVPYTMSPEFNQNQVQQIISKINEFHRKTCLRWLDLAESPEAVNELLSFVKAVPNHCRLRVTGTANVSVSVELSDLCFQQKIVLHMMMQALGFRNEHQRYDRNCYITVSPSFVNSSSMQIIRQEPWLERYPYDMHSVMHYWQSSVLASRRNLLETLGSPEDTLSELDLSKVLYKYCGGRHICDVTPDRCTKWEAYKRGINCFPG